MPALSFIFFPLMTPEEQAYFSRLGSKLLQEFHHPISSSTFFGISVGLSSYAAYLLRTHRLRRRPALILLLTAFVCFLLTIANFGTITSAIAAEFQMITAEESEEVPDDFRKVYYAYFLTQYAILYISDAVVIWRTYALYPDRPHLFWLPGICAIASIVCLTAGFTIEKQVPERAPGHVSAVGRAVDDVGQVLSLSTNVLTTVYVAIRLWSHRRWFIHHMDGDSYTHIQKKLLILVETGALFCIVQIITVGFIIAVDIVAPTGHMPRCSTSCMAVGWVIHRFRFAFAANYSILVLVLVYSKKSFTDTCYLSQQQEPQFTTVVFSSLGDTVELSTRENCTSV